MRFEDREQRNGRAEDQVAKFSSTDEGFGLEMGVMTGKSSTKDRGLVSGFCFMIYIPYLMVAD